MALAEPVGVGSVPYVVSIFAKIVRLRESSAMVKTSRDVFGF
jgi:hypothetical protein